MFFFFEILLFISFFISGFLFVDSFIFNEKYLKTVIFKKLPPEFSKLSLSWYMAAALVCGCVGIGFLSLGEIYYNIKIIEYIGWVLLQPLMIFLFQFVWIVIFCIIGIVLEFSSVLMWFKRDWQKRR